MTRRYIGSATIRDGVLVLPPGTLPADPPVEVEVWENVEVRENVENIVSWELIFDTQAGAL